MASVILTRVSEYLDAIAHLPAGAALHLEGVSWEEYEELLSALQDQPHLRLTYRQGTLDIMTLSKLHESLTTFITRLLQILSEEYEVELETCGSTTYKQAPDEQGTEPDECVCVGRPERILGKDRITLGVDPTPEIMIEIDLTHSSSPKLDIYARYGVPEVWLFAAQRMRLYELTGQGYQERAESRYFPAVTADQLTEVCNRSQQEGQSKTLKEFRAWLRQRISQNHP
jgi:Uma2 family endonuclease